MDGVTSYLEDTMSFINCVIRYRFCPFFLTSNFFFIISFAECDVIWKHMLIASNLLLATQ